MPPSLFEACKPHEDVLEGRLQEDQFAASASGVAHNPETAPAVYSDPAEFFAKTYPTEGLQELLEMVVKAVLAAEVHFLSYDSTNSHISRPSSGLRTPSNPDKVSRPSTTFDQKDARSA